MSEELKRCPFCGEENEIGTEYVELSCPQELGAFVICKQCGAMTRTCATVDEAIQLWNTRPVEDALNNRIAELTVLVDRLIKISDWATTGMVISSSYSSSSDIRKLAEKYRSEFAKLEEENAGLRLIPQPFQYWTEEKKQIYEDSKIRSEKS